MRQLLLAGDGRPWLLLFAAARLGACAFAVALVLWDGFTFGELGPLLYGPASTAALLLSPRLRSLPVAWLADSVVVLGLLLGSGDWRSPFYPLWLTTLALPAVLLPLRRAAVLAGVAPLAFFAVAFLGGPAPGDLNLVSSETLAIHVVLPFGVVAGLAYAAEVLRQLQAERARREQLAVEQERRRIAWELHDSAKQRVHAAHLLVTSLRRRADPALLPLVERAVVELESATADMDTSVAELRAPLGDKPLEEALRARAQEMATADGPRITVHGRAPQLPALVAAHAYRIGCEALTNALRHADASAIDLTLADDGGDLRLHVHDDGRGLPAQARDGASGLLAMRSRAESIGGRLQVGADATGAGTVVRLDVPLNEESRR